MNFQRNIKPLHLLIATCVCIVLALLLASWLAPRLVRDQESSETLTVDTGGPNIGKSQGTIVNPPPKGIQKVLPTPTALQPDGTACIQVVTTAHNPATGETANFPTPCDVPKGWEILSPSVNASE